MILLIAIRSNEKGRRILRAPAFVHLHQSRGYGTAARLLARS